MFITTGFNIDFLKSQYYQSIHASQHNNYPDNGGFAIIFIDQNSEKLKF